ncbi:hypothetical protein ACQUQU_09715 [Thalassolituus sp. LLYu03]|uniref:hypothetical protein n=1 Tax=Thalassolituus sp. LLYu03 TaxID=3421656 RepID=UPI003D2D5B40
MCKRVVLHIGSEKTATTFMQHFFSVNRDQLLRDGVYYPTSAFSKHAQFSLVSPLCELDSGRPLEFIPKDIPCDFNFEWTPLIREFNERSDFHTMLLSVEHFSSRLKHNGLAKLAELLGSLNADHIDIVYYFRRQDSYFQSSYSTYVKSGGTKSVADMYKSLISNQWFFDSNFLIEQWKKHMPSARYFVRSYELAVRGSGILADFAAATGLEFGDAYVTPELDRNESWSPSMLSFARYVNEHISDRLGSDRYRLLQSFYLRSGIKKEKVKNILPLSDRHHIMERYEESNRRLCQLYGLDFDGLFSLSEDDGYRCPDNIRFSQSELYELILSLL